MWQRSARLLGKWNTDANRPGESHFLAAPNDDVEIPATMFITKPIFQVGKWPTGINGRQDLLVVFQSIGIEPKPPVAVLQQLLQQFVEAGV